ncbi:MAG: acetyl-CoA C-acyltransferase [Pirellula sp.]
MAVSYLIAGCRTPIGKYLGGLSSLSAPELGGHAIKGAVLRSGLEAVGFDQVLMGQVIQAGAGQAPARQAAAHAGIPTSVGAATVHKVCGSGLFAVMLADMAIRAGEYHRVVAGGMESMSQAPHLLRNGRAGWKYGDQSLLDSNDVDGLRCAKLGLSMGCVGEWLAQDAHISRLDQDQWSVTSHARAVRAQDEGKLAREIVPIQVMEMKKQVVLANDESPRRDCTMEGLAKLRPAFLSRLVNNTNENYSGTVTAGNASTLSDGAAALVVVDEATMRNVTTDWVFKIVGHATFAADHQRTFTAPVGAVRSLLKKTNYSVQDIDLFEINEAFAAQTVACVRELEIDPDKVNTQGGAIALGHPLGCSGARVLVALLNQLADRKLNRGIATLCLGGGEAVALMVERP